MNIWEIIILAVALALDAMIVSFSYGLVFKSKRLFQSLVLAFFFGLFQFLMPVLGWCFTGYVYKYLSLYSKWIVFIVFMWLGIKFLKEAFSKKDDVSINCISLWCLIYLSFATSIDAFGAGVSLRFLNTQIIIPSVLIGVVTTGLSLFGFFAAGVFHKFKSKYVEIAGALLLIYLAVKSLDIF